MVGMLKKRGARSQIHPMAGEHWQRTANKSTKPAATMILLLSFLGALPLLASCSQPQTDPLTQTIPTDSDQWQNKLGDTFEQLSEDERQLLSRYMLRMKLSDAYESGAMPRTTIKQALVQQREYERLHPNNPTGEKSPVIASKAGTAAMAETYPIALLPVKSSDSDSLNQVKLQFMLSNHGTSAIKSFEGVLIMKDDQLREGKRFVIPHTDFEPPITTEQSGKIIINSSIEDINVMRAIRNTQDVNIAIDEGTLTLTDGQQVRFSQSLSP